MDTSAVVYAFASIAAVIFVAKLSARLIKFRQLAAIPTVGSSSWIGSWWYAFRYLTEATELIEEGYEKHKSLPFKVATPSGWIVLLSSPEHVDELRMAPDDILSILEFANEILQIVYTMGAELHDNPYHIQVLRSRLTRNIRNLYPEIRNETVAAFDEILDLKGNEWKTVPALDSMRQIVCRTSNRVFVGLPLCRNSDWINLNIMYTIDINKARSRIQPFPPQLKALAVRLFTNIPQTKRLGARLLGPIIEERRKCLNEQQNLCSDKPNDFLSWLIEEAEGQELTIESLTNRLLVTNFAAVQSTAGSFTHALFYLVTNPQYIQPLREEVEDIIEKDGWTKTALDKMLKVDSFLKECQRIEGLNCVSMSRKALTNYTFSDGTFIPEGTTIFAASRCMHRDEASYENAQIFEPFRFVGLRQQHGASGKYQYASPTLEYLPFGYGRHACPGRFLAAAQLKTMLAHVVVTYDIKWEDNAARPRSFRFMTANLPDPSAKIMFRRRV